MKSKLVLHGSNKRISVKGFFCRDFNRAGVTIELADPLSPSERAKTQGFNDLLLGFAAAAGSFGNGIIFAASGYGSLGLAAAAAALIPLGLAVWW